MHINELSRLLLTKHHPTVELVKMELFRLKSEELMRLGNVLRMDPTGYLHVLTAPSAVRVDFPVMSNRTVLISGAGIAGPTLAFWLQRAGFTPTLTERAPALRTGGYVIDFWGLGYDIAERMGLEGNINRVGYHVREMRIVDDRGKCVAGFGTKVFGDLTDGRYVTVGRSDLSRLVFERIKDTTEVIFDDEIVGLQEQPDCMQVQFSRTPPRRFDL